MPCPGGESVGNRVSCMRPFLWVIDTLTSCVDTLHVYLPVCLCDVEVDVVCGTGDLMRVLFGLHIVPLSRASAFCFVFVRRSPQLRTTLTMRRSSSRNACECSLASPSC